MVSNTDLNKLQIPLAEVRMWIVEQMRAGKTEYPLGDFLLELHRIYREKEDDLQSLENT